MSFGYKGDLRWADQYFEKGMGIPAAGSAVAAHTLKVGGHAGALALKVAAGAPVALAAAKKLTVEVLHCDAEDGTYVAHEALPTIVFTGAAGGSAWQAGQNMLTLALPDCKPFVRVRVATDAAAAGALDIYLDYIAR